MGSCRSTQKGVSPDGLNGHSRVFHGEIHTSWVDPQDLQKEGISWVQNGYLRPPKMTIFRSKNMVSKHDKNMLVKNSEKVLSLRRKVLSTFETRVSCFLPCVF